MKFTAKLVYGVEFTCFGLLPEMKGALCFWAVSPSYAMTGWRVGYAAAPKEIIRRDAIKSPITMSVLSTIVEMGRSKP